MLSIVILFIFLIENIATLVAVGLHAFFTNLFYVADLIVVVVSLSIEIWVNAAHATNESIVAEVVGLIVFVRLWRFVRIAHGELRGVLVKWFYFKHFALQNQEFSKRLMNLTWCDCICNFVIAVRVFAFFAFKRVL